MDVILFLVFAIIAVVCAINVVVQKHPISSALSLVGVMGSLAVLYLLLGAEFIAAAQVIVYAGAVMVLDDYGWSRHIVQKHAFDAFAAKRGVLVLPLPTGQGLIVKP